MTVNEVLNKLSLKCEDLKYLILIPQLDGKIKEPYAFMKVGEHISAYIKRISKCSVISYDIYKPNDYIMSSKKGRIKPIRVVFNYNDIL